jgi:hypothetical protein
MKIINTGEDMARIRVELERVLGPSKHGVYLDYIANMKEVLPSPERSIEHHVLPEALFPKFKNLHAHPWNGLYLTQAQHQTGHVFLLADYPSNLRLSDALKMVWHTTNLSLSMEKVNKIIKHAKAIGGKATVNSMKIARKLGVSNTTVRKVLIANGIKTMSIGEALQIPAKEQEIIIRLAKVVNGNATAQAKDISRIVGVSDGTVRNLLIRNGIKPMNKGGAQLLPQKIQKRIIRLAKVVDGKATVSAHSIASQMGKVGSNGSSVTATLRRNGIKSMTRSEASKAHWVKRIKSRRPVN